MRKLQKGKSQIPATCYRLPGQGVDNEVEDNGGK